LHHFMFILFIDVAQRIYMPHVAGVAVHLLDQYCHLNVF
jgi:hypothetical protein